jgi:hypothetical protein
VKTTPEIPDTIFCRAKSMAYRASYSASRVGNGSGQEEAGPDPSACPATLDDSFQQTRRLRKETANMNRIIEAEFEHAEAEEQMESGLWPRANQRSHRFCAGQRKLQ